LRTVWSNQHIIGLLFFAAKVFIEEFLKNIIDDKIDFEKMMAI